MLARGTCTSLLVPHSWLLCCVNVHVLSEGQETVTIAPAPVKLTLGKIIPVPLKYLIFVMQNSSVGHRTGMICTGVREWFFIAPVKYPTGVIDRSRKFLLAFTVYYSALVQRGFCMWRIMKMGVRLNFIVSVWHVWWCGVLQHGCLVWAAR
jgi:hypothetical protein